MGLPRRNDVFRFAIANKKPAEAGLVIRVQLSPSSFLARGEVTGIKPGLRQDGQTCCREESRHML